MTTERWEAIARELGDYDLCDGSMVKANSFVPEDDLPGEWVRAEPAGKRIAELQAQLAQETANNTILEAKLAYRDSAQVTHSEECWRVHHGCAVRKVEDLARASSDDAEAKFRAQIHALEAKEQRDKLRELLREVAGSGIELERVQEETRSDG